MAKYTKGQTVEIFKYGHWYPGTVVQVGTTRVWVQFTNKASKMRTLPFPQHGDGAPVIRHEGTGT